VSKISVGRSRKYRQPLAPLRRLFNELGMSEDAD
jgi:hypothetical protein